MLNEKIEAERVEIKITKRRTHEEVIALRIEQAELREEKLRLRKEKAAEKARRKLKKIDKIVKPGFLSLKEKMLRCRVKRNIR